MILCPVLLIGGFADLYTDTVFRLINKLKCPKRAILGPWGHEWPDIAYPGPQIGFLLEIVKWLDYYIKGIDNGYDKKEIISIYKLNPNIDELHSIVKQRKGKWIHLNDILFYPNEHLQRNDYFTNENQQINQKQIKYYLSFGSLTTEPISNNLFPNKISFLSPQQTGISCGNLCGLGYVHHPSNAIDQREDDGRSLCFDSLPLTNDYELFGFPTVKLNLSSSSQVGLICVHLCMIDQNTSSSILIARGVLNLTHHQSHEHPKLLNINQIYNIEVTLSGICVCLPAGCRLRLALSTSYWPIVWPSSQLATLTQSSSDRFRIFNKVNQTIILQINEDDGSIEYPDGLIWDERSESVYQIKNNNPQLARIEILRYLKYYFKNESSIKVDIQTESIMFTQQSPSTYQIIHQLDITNNDQPFFNKTFNLSFPRIYN
ncbi:unnamed protein product [Rotaria sordida]|uniref:Xaa-Pro dipeptidyl-peptidase C-terminal domain-containing protein n=1 Tax=Rotaria sordida TaxID=392033 RepID=A0A814Y9F7_9BILA|nr:unnamed protein product [Rotaria sordida]